MKHYPWCKPTTEKSPMHGATTSEVEVSLATNKGFWLFLGGEELFVSFADFPWFKQATLDQLTTVEQPTTDHLYWPLMDVDLSVASIRDPSRFPLLVQPI
jgi:hypothetical protein